MYDNPYRFIGVGGCISAGKSDLCRLLAEEMSVDGSQTVILDEPADQTDSRGKVANPFLPDYYEESDRLKDPAAPRPKASVSFLMQIHLFVERKIIHDYAASHVTARKGHVIVDQILHNDASFARVQAYLKYMSQREFGVYARLYDAMINAVKLPTILVHLDVDPEVCVARIRRRALERTGRECEKVIETGYLARLRKEMSDTADVLEQRGVGVIRLDWNEELPTDELRRPRVRALAKQIREKRVVSDFVDLHLGII